MQFNTLENSVGKILLVGDLHLATKEMSSTKKMVHNNIVMLENLYDYVIENTDINILIFLGDIQHYTPASINATREMYRWTFLLKKIGEVMAERYHKNQIYIKRVSNAESDKYGNYATNEHGLKIPYTEDINQSILNKEILPLFTLRGNHDIDKVRVNGLQLVEDSDLLPFTYYDYCITEGIMINPEQLVINDELLINFYNYGEVEKVYEKDDNAKHTIGLYHDMIETEDTPEMFRGQDSCYLPEVAVQHEDVIYLGHVHTKSEASFLDVNGRTVPVIIVGSMGRTSTDEGQIRDVGYCQAIDTSDLDSIESVSIDVIPANVYFSLKEKLARDVVKQEMIEFSLTLEDDSEINEMLNAKELIAGLQIDNEVKITCLDLLQEVENK